MAKDSLHKDDHSITGEHSWYLESYDLTTHKTEDLKNFPAVQKDEYYTMENIRNGDWFGSTDTDYNSHVHEDESKTKDHSRSPGSEMGYSKINDTHGKAGDKWTFETSSPRMADNLNAKPVGIKSPLRDAANTIRKRPGKGKD